MPFEFLNPLSESLLSDIEQLPATTIKDRVVYNTGDILDLDLASFDIAILGCKEYRNSQNAHFTSCDLESVRLELYSLFPGNWDSKIVDLGDIEPGEEIADTYYAVKTITAACLKAGTLLVSIGGSQDLMYPMYRAFDGLHNMINAVNIDCRFDLGNIEAPINARSYVGKMVSEEPYNLFNYCNLGFQTYYNSQEEIDLLDRMYFDAVRLGALDQDLKISEPYLRDADFVGVDMQSVASSGLAFAEANPNGFDGKQLCTLARYAGISDRSKILSIFEFPLSINKTPFKLISELIWYFIEGVSLRCNEHPVILNDSFLKYQVPLEEELIVFYKSTVSGRWWVELPFFIGHNNKLKQHTLLPCDENDYKQSITGVLPPRWLRARMKNEI
jgi:hypothetical protein